MSRFLRARDEEDDDDDDEEEEEEEEEDDEEDDSEEEGEDAGPGALPDLLDVDDDMSSETLGPPGVLASFVELGKLLGRFVDLVPPSGVPEQMGPVYALLHELKDWVVRLINDRDRNVFEPATSLMFDRQGEVAEKALALLKHLLVVAKTDDEALHGLGEMCQILDSLRSEAEVIFEIEEKDLNGVPGYKEPKEVVLPQVWQTLDREADQLHRLMFDLLSVVMTAQTTSLLSVTQAFVIDRVRNVFCKLLLNWMHANLARLNTDDALYDYPYTPSGVRRLGELSPEDLRTALVFLEAFCFCLDRDVISVYNREAALNLGLRPFGHLFVPQIVALLSPSDVHDTTKLFALRMVQNCPLIMFVEQKLSLVVFGELFRHTRDPCVIAQISTAVMGILNTSYDTMSNLIQEVDMGEENFPGLVDSMFVCQTRLRIASTSMSPVDCTNALVGVGNCIDVMLGLWTDQRFSMDAFRGYCVTRGNAVMASMSALTRNKMAYVRPTLGQWCALSFSSEEVWGELNRGDLPVGGWTVATHAYYARLQRIVLLLTDIIVLNAVIDHTEADGDLASAARLFYEGCDVLADEELFRFITHTKAVLTFQRHEDCLMSHLVNGGHLDNGALSESTWVDFFVRAENLRWKLVMEHFNTYDLICDRLMSNNRKNDAETTVQWARVLDTVHAKDDPRYLEVLKAEAELPSCSPSSLTRINELLNSACLAFCGVLNFVIRVKPDPVTVVERIVKLALTIEMPPIMDADVRDGIAGLLRARNLTETDRAGVLAPLLVSRDYGLLRYIVQKDLSVVRMGQRSLSRLLQRRRAVIEAVEGLIAFHGQGIELMRSVGFHHRDLEPLLIYFVTLTGSNLEDEHYPRLFRALNGFCAGAVLAVQVAQSVMLAKGHKGPMAEFLQPLASAMMYVASCVSAIFVNEPDAFPDGSQLADLGPVMCEFVIDCFKYAPDVTEFQEPLFAISTAVQQMCYAGLQIDLFDEMMELVTRRETSWQQNLTEALSRVYRDAANLVGTRENQE